ncbi:MAG: radical SAM protein [Roseiflexaceae bacterium]
MPALEQFMSITDRDLVHCDSFLTDGDCDCACPDDGFMPNPVAAGAEDAAYILPALHIAELADEFALAFNPLGSAGVVVLNQTTLALLSAFQQPHPLAEGAQLIGAPVEGLNAARRCVDLGLLEPATGVRQPRRAQAQTLTAWLHITNACNLRCDYCYIHKTPDKMEIERGIQAVDAVFRSAVAHDFRRVKLKYAGGEASLNFPLVLILHDHARSLAEQHGMKLDGVLLSNGVRMNERMIEELRARGLRLMISLDGVGAYHDAQRHFSNGHGSFAHIERTLDLLAAHNFIPSISITISNRNIRGLSEVVNYVLKRHLPFTLNFYRENECSSSFIDLAFGDEQVIAAMKAAFAVIEANLPPYSLLGALIDRARLDMPHDRPCGVGHSYLVIDQHGGVAKCQMEIEQTITDISVADPLSVIREDTIGIQNYRVEEKVGCRDCTWRYWCAGGCPALTYRVTGRFDVKSPNCRIYKALFPEVLRLEGLRLLKYSEALVA